MRAEGRDYGRLSVIQNSSFVLLTTGVGKATVGVSWITRDAMPTPCFCAHRIAFNSFWLGKFKRHPDLRGRPDDWRDMRNVAGLSNDPCRNEFNRHPSLYLSIN